MSVAGVLNNQIITDNARTMVKEAHEVVPSPAITPGGIGRIKAPPSSALEGLSGPELSQMCFSPDQAKISSAVAGRLIPSPSLTPVHVCRDSPSTATSSIGSSAHKNEMAPPVPVAVVKDVQAPAATGETTPSGSSAATATPPAATTSSVINAKVLKRTTSRQGREKQRWERDVKENHLYRLTTGAVPIMQDGKILLVSSSRKEEWILPKGGWDNDESLEESAIREVYEEAGVIGSLGPRLTDIIYETKKAKKRRLEREEMLLQHRREKSEGEAPKSHDSVQSESEDHTNQKPGCSTPERMNTTAALNDPLSVVANLSAQRPEVNSATNNSKPVIPNADATVAGVAARIRASLEAEGSVATAESTASTAATYGFDDAASVASAASCTSDGTSPNTHVKLSLFVLYVTEALNEWPESGRSRKVVSIDEAIATMESQDRPEFRAALMEVKQMGLHNVTSEQEGTVQSIGEAKEEMEMSMTDLEAESPSEDKKI